MPHLFRDEWELSAAGKERDHDRMMERAERVSAQNEKTLQAIIGPAVTGPDGKRPPLNLHTLDEKLETGFSAQLKGLLDRVDTDFTPEELEPDERGFLKQTILSVFKRPGDLVGDAGEQVLKDTIGAGKDVHGTRYKMNGAFAEASGKAAVMININPGTTASQEESGNWVPAADVLEADVRTLAKAVGEAADSYYEQGLHRTHAAKPGGPAL